MADMGPQSLLRAACPACQSLVLVNRDGRLRHHRGRERYTCPGSRQPAPGGSVRVLKLRDGVVIKVFHAPGTLADKAITDELLLLDAEWCELALAAAQTAAAAAVERVACLADECRATAGRGGRARSSSRPRPLRN